MERNQLIDRSANDMGDINSWHVVNFEVHSVQSIISPLVKMVNNPLCALCGSSLGFSFATFSFMIYFIPLLHPPSQPLSPTPL